jgi:hypothetical protein
MGLRQGVGPRMKCRIARRKLFGFLIAGWYWGFIVADGSKVRFFGRIEMDGVIRYEFIITDRVKANIWACFPENGTCVFF